MANGPQTRFFMLRAGYKRLSSSTCSNCSAPIEWWLTLHKKRLPILAQGDENTEIIVHFARDCQERGNNAPPVKPVAPAPRPSAGQRSMIEQELLRLLDRTGARAITFVDHDGVALFAYRLNLDPEDVRMDLISAANKVREALRTKETFNG